MTSLTEKIKNAWAKIKTIKNIEIIIGIVIICLIVLIYSSVTAKAADTKPSIGSKDSSAYGTSASELEKRLSEILSEIDGAGTVSVMITQEESKEVGQAANDKAMIKGVVIVADGADDIRVRISLTTATKTLLDVNANSIQIFSRK